MSDFVELERFAYTPMGTFGRLYIPEFECFTIERPWRSNEPRTSCIPEGEYELRLGMFNRGGYECYEVLGVPGRTLIKIHIGNTMDDVIGCIAPGKALGWAKQKWAVMYSKPTFHEFMEAMGGIKDSHLKIAHWSPE